MKCVSSTEALEGPEGPERVYTVCADTDPPTCDCADFAVRRQICKHGVAVWMWQVLQQRKEAES